MNTTNTPCVAIVIFVIGDEYRKSFTSIFEPNVIAYCKKHGYDLYILDKLLRAEPDMTKKKFFWQRLLVPSAFSKYDYVVSMDSDIFVHPDSPPLPLHEIPIGKVAAVNERKYFNNYEWRETVQLKRGWEKTGREWHALSGEERPYNDHLNGGFVIYQPKYHAEIMKELYDTNIDNYMKYHQDDQSILSLFLIDNNMIHWLDERYDRIWLFWKEIMYPEFDHYPMELKKMFVKNFIQLNYFTHFTSGIDIDLIESSCERPYDGGPM